MSIHNQVQELLKNIDEWNHDEVAAILASPHRETSETMEWALEDFNRYFDRDDYGPIPCNLDEEGLSHDGGELYLNYTDNQGNWERLWLETIVPSETIRMLINKCGLEADNN